MKLRTPYRLKKNSSRVKPVKRRSAARPSTPQISDGEPVFARKCTLLGVAVFTVFLNSCVGAHEPAEARPVPTALAEPLEVLAIVRDGGASFFGAEFDVESHSFTHLAFNGNAWCRIPGDPS
jgi:hypothetical protein